MDNPSGESDNNQLVKKQLSYNEIAQISKAFVASGMFGRDMQKISQGITKIMAGQELGLAPFASMRAVHVIDGNATLSANTMAGMVKSSGRYDYEVKKKEVDECIIDFFEIRNNKRVKIGTESFNEAEAKSAGLLNKQNWQKYPKAMMFARCISNGVRTYCPDVFSGMLVYTPDELNATVGADGNVIDVNEDGSVKNAPAPAETTAKEAAAKDAELVEEQAEADEVITDEDLAELEDGMKQDSAEDQEESIEVDGDFKEAAWGMFESLPLKPAYKIRFLKDVTGAITQRSLKTDEQWKALYNRCEEILGGESKLPDEYVVDGQQEIA